MRVRSDIHALTRREHRKAEMVEKDERAYQCQNVWGKQATGLESTKILKMLLDEMLDAICHDVDKVAKANRLSQECIIQKS